MLNVYYDNDRMKKAVEEHRHRQIVGGMWDEIGALQLDYLKQSGLKPHMRLLDLGCGSLRGGLHFIPYLDPGRYYGIDLSQPLLQAGYDIELAQAGLRDRMPRENLMCNSDFDASGFGVRFDMIIAQSVFTHLPIPYLLQALIRLTDVTDPGARVFATAFICRPGQDWSQPIRHDPGDIVTHPLRDPFHYRTQDLTNLTEGLAWELESLRDWNHPRDQVMATFRRI